MGNPASNNLPADLDMFLQDISQTYGTISYKDISQFNPTTDQRKKLRGLQAKRKESADEDYSVLSSGASKIAELLKGE